MTERFNESLYKLEVVTESHISKTEVCCCLDSLQYLD